MAETRSLLASAIDALDERDRKQAFKHICRATELLGEPNWPEGHPAGVALHYADIGHDLVIVNEIGEAKEQLREAAQLVIAAEHQEGVQR